jgi:arylsulfatase A-like enzyme/GT2 family glycosyltransferase
MKLTVLICTHNRAALLERTLASLNAAAQPANCSVDILVVANACSDGTAAFLDSYLAASAAARLPLRWVHELKPGKSNALNRARSMLDGDVVAFADDDHRVDHGYLEGICRAAHAYPDATLFCGRILPDWDGEEPAWVHDTGPYRIYPLPIPRADLGPDPRALTIDGPLPGGGNLFLRRAVFDRVGGFSTELGPHGHDLGGGEDSDFVARCLKAGERLQYVPWVTQYHYVDASRLRFSYLMRKSFQRSRSGIRVGLPGPTAIPLYLWRKLAGYLLLGLFSLSWSRTRFYLIRLAAVIGEVRGYVDSLAAPQPSAAPRSLARFDATRLATWLALPLLACSLAVIGKWVDVRPGVAAVLSVALICAAALAVKSFYDFSQTGPQLKAEILRHYRLYSALALLRLTSWSFVFCVVLASLGVLAYITGAILLDAQVRLAPAIVAAVAGLLVLTGRQFCRHLLFLPASIAASYHYRQSRLYPLWRLLTPERLTLADRLVGTTVVALLAASAWKCLLWGQASLGIALVALAVGGACLGRALSRDRVYPVAARKRPGPPNILMIGSDTLRADRIGSAGYGRRLTPFIDALAAKACLFTACYVPCARTAPSLVSMLTGTWPCRHGIRDNFIGDEDTALAVPCLPDILARDGYRTAAVSDWSGSDLGKFSLGFDVLDLPKDQWNIKYLLRQGPKDLRLFLSLFTHNQFGKRFLPELYYLAGVPLTALVGADARTLISRFAPEEQPFFLNMFVSTTHPPFGSEYPYYTLFKKADYAGESQFVMARLTDPWEIIRRQGDSSKEFDLPQIIDLYDGCVRNFDDEVRRVVEHLRACDLEENTIVVIYSDHGMEFFEHDTWGQGNSVRGDFSNRVPLLIMDPRRKVGKACPYVVRSIDLAPTLLELVGIAPPAGADGVSLVRYLDGSSPDMGLAAYAETGLWLTALPGAPVNHLRYPSLLDLVEVQDKRSGTLSIRPEYRQIINEAKDRMVRHGPWKLVYQPTSDGALYSLYNVTEDPECRHDRGADHPSILAELQRRLHAWIDLKNGDRCSDAAPAATDYERVQVG